MTILLQHWSTEAHSHLSVFFHFYEPFGSDLPIDGVFIKCEGSYFEHFIFHLLVTDCATWIMVKLFIFHYCLQCRNYTSNSRYLIVTELTLSSKYTDGDCY